MSETKTPVDFSVEETKELAARIGFAWRDIRRGTTNNVVRELIFEGPDFSIEPGQYDTLEMIVLHESIRMGDLADALRVDPSTATRAVQRLIKDGYAERVSHDGDGRVVFVGPTETGRHVYTRVIERRRVVLMAIMGKFEPEERVLLAEMLQKFSVTLDETVTELANSQK